MSNDEQFRLLTSELKQLCDNGKETEQNLDRTTEILLQFGQLYQDESPDKISLIRSAAFYNAALVRRPEHDETKHKLNKLCSHVLDICPAIKKDIDLCQVTNEVKKLILDMRDFTNKSLKKLDKIPIGLESDDLHKMEKQKIDTVQNIQNKITEKFTEVMDYISKRCIEIMGDPPCQYSIVGMGSLARKEITPYSDFEHVIVLEEGVQDKDNYQDILEYFRWFSVIFHIIIINLQESIVRSVASPYLNDDLIKGGDWYFDAYTTCGIKFDGMQIHACKFPLGRFRTTDAVTETVELIQPISKMAKFLTAEEEKKNGFHLADVLTKTCFVSGDEEICQKFQSKVFETLKCERFKAKDEVIKQLDEDLAKFNLLGRIAFTEISNQCDIKRLLYRTTTLFMSALGRLTGIHKNSSFDIIGCLLERKIVNESTAHRLSYAVSIACETRLKVYMEKKGQDDFYGDRSYDYDERKTLMQLIGLIGEQSLADYLIIAYAWQKAIKQNSIDCLYECTIKEFYKFQTLMNFDLRNQFDFEKENFFLRESLKPNVETFFILYTVAKMAMRSENCAEALNIFEMLSAFTQKHNLEQNEKEIARNMPNLIGDCLLEQSQCLVVLHRYDDALSFIEKAQNQLKKLNLIEDPYNFYLGSILHYKGRVFRNIAQFEAAILSYNQSMLHLSRSEIPFKKAYIINNHFGLANSHYKIGNIYESIDHLKSIYNLHFDATVRVSLVAICCQALYENLLTVGEMEEAKFYLQKALDLRMQYVPAEEHSTDRHILFCKERLKTFPHKTNTFAMVSAVPH